MDKIEERKKEFFDEPNIENENQLYAYLFHNCYKVFRNRDRTGKVQARARIMGKKAILQYREEVRAEESERIRAWKRIKPIILDNLQKKEKPEKIEKLNTDNDLWDRVDEIISVLNKMNGYEE